jgi:hypothetical protein
MAKSFFATLECELIDRRSWPTKTEARMALFSYIEGWYNGTTRADGTARSNRCPRPTSRANTSTRHHRAVNTVTHRRRLRGWRHAGE